MPFGKNKNGRKLPFFYFMIFEFVSLRIFLNPFLQSDVNCSIRIADIIEPQLSIAPDNKISCKKTPKNIARNNIKNKNTSLEIWDEFCSVNETIILVLFPSFSICPFIMGRRSFLRKYTFSLISKWVILISPMNKSDVSSCAKNSSGDKGDSIIAFLEAIKQHLRFCYIMLINNFQREFRSMLSGGHRWGIHRERLYQQ